MVQIPEHKLPTKVLELIAVNKFEGTNPLINLFVYFKPQPGLTTEKQYKDEFFPKIDIYFHAKYNTQVGSGRFSCMFPSLYCQVKGICGF